MAHGRIEKCATSFETKYDRQQSKTRSFRRHQHFLFFRSLIDRLLVGNIFRYVQRGSHHWHSIQIRCVVSWKHQTLVLAVMSLDSAQPWKLCWFPCLFFAFVSVVLVKMSPDPSPCCGCGVCQSCVRCLQSRVSFPKYNDKEKRQHSSDIIFFRIPRLLISRVSFAILSKIPQLS